MSESKSEDNLNFDTQLFVVCDANGVCYGIFLLEDKANHLADKVGGYVSSHRVSKETKV